jgi:hypothetical protein
MTENWELAMHKVTGEYVIYCGDDDAVLPQIGPITQWAKDNVIDNVLGSINSVYYWPSYADSSRAGYLKSLPYRGTVVFPDIHEVIRINSHGPKMPRYQLQPEVYTGIMRTSIIQAMKQKTGRYFGSVIPDLYFAFAVAPFVKRYCVLDFPFMLGGHSGKANASRFVKNVMHEQEEQFVRYEWDDSLPHIGDFVSFYIDSKFKAYRDSGQEQLIENLDIANAFANCLMNTPRTKSKTKKLLSQFAQSCKVRKVNAVAGYADLIWNLFVVLLQRINLKMPPQLHLYNRHNNALFKLAPTLNERMETIADAIVCLQQFIGKNSVHVEGVLQTASRELVKKDAAAK